MKMIYHTKLDKESFESYSKILGLGRGNQLLLDMLLYLSCRVGFLLMYYDVPKIGLMGFNVEPILTSKFSFDWVV